LIVEKKEIRGCGLLRRVVLAATAQRDPERKEVGN
jgi:hypothetical protein